MFVRSTRRKNDGKEHRYFSVVENQRVSGDKIVQRTVLYLGEINDAQQVAWRKTLEVFDEDQQDYRTLSLQYNRANRQRVAGNTSFETGTFNDWNGGPDTSLRIVSGDADRG